MRSSRFGAGYGRRAVRVIPMLATFLIAVAITLIPSANAMAQAATITIGRPVEVQLIPPGVITADGSPQVLTFVVTDEMGGLAAEARFRGSSIDQGRLTEWTQVGPGIWTCIFTPPDNSQVKQALLKIKAKVGSKTATKEFTLQLRPPPFANFTFEATPATPTLGRDPNASLVFVVSGRDGGPLDGLNLQVETTAGTVQNVVGMGGGRYQALYIPPAGEIAPKVAVISVTDAAHPETATGFFVIPLIGNINWQVNTGMANVNVMMDVGNNRFGPFLSDASGIANAPILVPPGTRVATASVLMPDGSTTPPQAIDLMVPSFQHMVIAPTTAYMPGDGATPFPIYCYVVDETGQPNGAATIALTASSGTITEARHQGSGVYQAVYTPPLVQSTTQVTLNGSVPGVPQDVDSVTFKVVPPLPSMLNFSSNPPAVGNGDATLTLTGSVQGVDGKPADYLGVAFFGPDGQLGGTAPQGNGMYNGSYSGNFNKRVALGAAASLPATGQAPYALVAWPIDDQVATNRKTTIVAMAVDRYGLPVSGVPLNARVASGGGSVSGGGATDGYGRATFSITAAPLAGLSLVEITGGGITFTCPLWQTQSFTNGFVFPDGGGAIQGGMMARWSALRGKLLLGGAGGGAAAAVIVAPTTTVPTVSSATGNVWGSGGTTTTTTPTTTPTTTTTEPTTTTTEPTTTTTTEPTTTTTEPTTTTTTEPTTTVVPTTVVPVVPVVPTIGPATHIVVLAAPASLPKDGKATASVSVKVLDAQNRPVPGEQVVIVASAGTISNKIDNGDGTFTAILKAPKGGNDTQANVSASRLSGDLSAWAVVSLTASAKVKEKKPKAIAPATSNKYRTARILVRYPLAGYSYDMEPGDCGGEPCDYFPDMDVVGSGGSGLVAIPESIGFAGEIFPVEYVGAAVSFDRYGYRTDYSVTLGSGSDSVYKDTMNHVQAGARGRLPLLKNKTVGPLDILVDLGYHGQDVVVFHRHGGGSDTWTWENQWLHGFRIGFGARFQLVSFVQLHGGWAGTIVGSGLVTNEFTFGGTFRVFKGLTLDAHYRFIGRNLHLTTGDGPDLQQGSIAERTHGLMLGAGWSF